MGPATDRDPAHVVRDVRDGMVSVAVARDVYKVAVNDDGSVDTEGTRRLRAGP
jgi:N-methylhydantoinase B